MNPSRKTLVLTALSWLLIAAPLPAMLRFSNPEGVVFGRYTGLYFALVAGVVGWSAVCAAIVAGRASGWIDRLPRLLWAGLATVILGGCGLHAAMIARLVVLPATVEDVLIVTLLPFIGAVLLVVGSLLTDDQRAQAAAWLPAAGWEAAGWVLVGLVAVLHSGLLLWVDVWQFSLSADSTLYLYFGEAVGDLNPYVDIYYFHPPARFVLSAVWTALADGLSLPAVVVARTWELLVTMGTVITAALIGKEFTGSSAGGLAAAAGIIGTEMMLVTTLHGPSFRTTVYLLMLLCLLAALHGRWLWSGAAVALAGAFWLPVLLTVLPLGVWLLLTAERRTEALGRLAAGGLLMFAAVGLLVGPRSMARAIVQTVGPSLNVVAGADIPGPRQVITNLSRVILFLLEFDLAVLAVSLVGLVWAGRRPAVLLVAGVGLVHLIAIRFNFDGSAADGLIALTLVFMFGGLLIDRLSGWVAGEVTALRRALSLVMACGLLLIAAGDAPSLALWLRSLEELTTSQQRAFYQAVDDALPPDAPVVSVGEAGLMLYSERETLTLPVIQVGFKALEANQAAGISEEAIYATMQTARPALVIAWPGLSEGMQQWLATNGYAAYRVNYSDFHNSSYYYVSPDYPALDALIAAYD